MSSTNRVLLWEYWQSIKWRVLISFCVMLVLPSLITCANLPMMRLTELVRHDFRPMPADGQMAVIWLNFVICVLTIGYAVGYPTRHYTLPISTGQLVFFRMIPGGLTCAGMHLLFASLFNWLVRSDFPYAGPAMSYGMGFMLGYAIVSRFYGRENLRTLAGLGGGILSIFWIFGHYQNVLTFGEDFRWPVVSSIESVVVVALSLLAWWIAKTGFELSRKGLGWAHTVIPIDRVHTLVNSKSSTRKRFRSPFAALFWREWRQDGWLWPLAMGCTCGLIASLMFAEHMIWRRRHLPSDLAAEIVAYTATFIAFGSFLPWFLGSVTAHGRKSQGNLPLPTSLTTLPVSDAMLGWVTIARNLASISMSWICMIIVGITWAIAYAIAGTEIDWSSIIPGPRQPAWYVIAFGVTGWIVFAAWLTTGVGTLAALSGRRWIALFPILVIPVWIGLVFAWASLPRQIAQNVLRLVLIAGPLVLVTGTFWAYLRTWNRNVIGWHSAIIGIAILLVVEGGLGVYWFSVRLDHGAQTMPSEMVCWFALFLALAAAPPAVVPLAVHYNRHR
jgi:hypothetical protein